MLFSSDVREDIDKWARAQGIDTNQIVAFEASSPPNLRKPGFTYKPITIPVDVPGMRFYQKVPTSPQGGLPDFGKLDPAPPVKSVDPKPKPKPKPKAEPEPEPVRKTSSATQSSVPKPAKETKPSVTFGKAHKPQPAKPTTGRFGRKGAKE